ncbi:hypothetical protein [Horticoccus sp. 23ND18S-11]|uniref:hypothetical protein n=1 Tax=Horticoccus sp. 23ND18S-11 TaxID=3391832 RepID=UPI0039C9D293
MNALHIDLQLALLRTYLRHNKTPEVVLLNLDSFSFETTKVGQIHDPALFLPHLSNTDLYRSLVKIDPVARKWRYIPLYCFAVDDMRFTWTTGLLGLVGYMPPEDYVNGYNPQDKQWNEDFPRFQKSHPDGVRYQIEPEGVQCLREFAITCRQHGISLVLIYSPEYHDMQNLVRNRAEIFSNFERIRSEHNLELWDFSSSSLCTSTRYFYNSQHLNLIGADLFSKEVGARLNASLSGSRVPR